MGDKNIKFLKLFSSAFALASFLFSSGSFAASRLCDGVINDETVLEDIEVINGASCIINDSTVYGFIVGDDSPNTILIYKTNVENRIVIRGAQTVAISDVKVDDGNIVVVDSVIASVVDNRTNSGEIRVNRNAEAYVFQNDAEGRIVCRNNGPWKRAGILQVLTVISAGIKANDQGVLTLTWPRADVASATSVLGRFSPLPTAITTAAHDDVEQPVTGRNRSYMLS